MDFQHWPESSGFLELLRKSHPMMEDVASSPFEVLERAGSITLCKYTAQNPAAGHPLFILPSVINRPFVLDLLPEKSLIQHFLKRGHDVYMIDWGVPSSHERDLDFEVLLTLHVQFLLQKAFQDAEERPFHVVGHCLGGTLGLMLAPFHKDKFLSLTLLTAPVDFSCADKLSQWARHPQFDVASFVEAYGNVPWYLLQSAFIALKPTQVTSKIRTFMNKSKDSRFLRNFWAMESWSNDNVNVRGSCFQVLLEALYRNNSLIAGDFTVGGQKVNLQDIQLPLFVLIADSDHIVPQGSHLTPHHTPKVKNFKSVTVEGGHVGALMSGKSQKVLWPQMTDWMRSCE